ncbi:MAG: PD-(D/E)XK nuclease family protein, partial [Acidimicrobiia bacterium]
AFDDVTTDLYDLPEADSGPAVPEAFSAFTSSRFATVTPWLVEAPFEVVVGDLRVRGRIDAVYQNEPGAWEIVDFKSGRRKDDPNLKVQLEAYALAAVREAVATTAPQTLDVTFAYLGGGLEVVTDHVDFLWMEQAADRLVTIATGITDREFAPTPSPACTGCDFLRFCPAGKQFVGAH